MKKALAILLSALIVVSLFISCGPEPKVQITIKFDANGAEGHMEDQKAYKGEEVILRRVAFIKEDNSFIGWNTEEKGNGDWYYDCDSAYFDKDVTLYAQWFNEVEEVLFNGNDGSGVMFPQFVKKNVWTNLRPNIYYKKGYYFAGWNTSADGKGKQYSDTELVRINEKLTLYAQWTEFGPTIAFNANGGEGAMIHQHVKKGEPTHLNENRFTKDGHFFLEWNTKKDGSGKQYADKAIIETDTNVILYAQWAVPITPDTTHWTDGLVYSLAEEHVAIPYSVYVSGSVTLILPEGRSLSAERGITVLEGNSLTIKGSGNLSATGQIFEPGIGCYYGENCGDIIIEGGHIDAVGGGCAAGIGGGYGSSGGNVKITGGTVVATGGENYAASSYPGMGIGRGARDEDDPKKKLSDGNLVVENVVLKYSKDGLNYKAYEGTDYSKRYQYMKAE